MRLVIKYIFLGYLIVLSNNGLPQCKINKVTSFQTGEKITFKVFYHWIEYNYAANATFLVDQKMLQNEPVYFFNATGYTNKKFDWIFKVCDKFQSCVSTRTLIPYHATHETSEGKYFARENYDFTLSGHVLTEIENSDHAFKRDTIQVSSCVFDLLTLIYYTRTIDFTNYNENDQIPVNLVDNGIIHPIYIRYLKRDIIKNRVDNKKYKCIELSVLCVNGPAFQDGENLKIWLSDDANKLPIVIQANIHVGVLYAYLSSMAGLCHHLDVIVN